MKIKLTPKQRKQIRTLQDKNVVRSNKYMELLIGNFMSDEILSNSLDCTDLSLQFYFITGDKMTVIKESILRILKKYKVKEVL